MAQRPADGYPRNDYAAADPFHAISGTVTVSPAMFAPTFEPEPWTDPFINPPAGYDPDDFDVEEAGATTWYRFYDGYGSPTGDGWRYEHRFDDEQQALLCSLLLHAGRIPFQRLLHPVMEDGAEVDLIVIVTDVEQLPVPDKSVEVPFTGLDFGRLALIEFPIDPDAEPLARSWGVATPPEAAGLRRAWLMEKSPTARRLVAQFLRSSGLPHVLAGVGEYGFVVFTDGGSQRARQGGPDGAPRPAAGDLPRFTVPALPATAPGDQPLELDDEQLDDHFSWLHRWTDRVQAGTACELAFRDGAGDHPHLPQVVDRGRVLQVWDTPFDADIVRALNLLNSADASIALCRVQSVGRRIHLSATLQYTDLDYRRKGTDPFCVAAVLVASVDTYTDGIQPCVAAVRYETGDDVWVFGDEMDPALTVPYGDEVDPARPLPVHFAGSEALATFWATWRTRLGAMAVVMLGDGYNPMSGT